jgi:hypothetical protein
LVLIHIEHICTFFVTFFSATMDGRDLIFGHKLHIGTPYRGKRFWTHQIPTSGTNKMNCELMLTYDTPALRQTGSTLYEACDQISDFAINSCLEKYN